MQDPNPNPNPTQKEVFRVAKNLLHNKPLIVWGSGATIPHGLPSMSDLNEKLKDEIKGFDGGDNLEEELSKDKYTKDIEKIKKAIFSEVLDRDIAFMEKLINGSERNSESIQSIYKMLFAFKKIHPNNLSIITSNYDRVLEHVMAWHNMPFTDGFNGKTFSEFDEYLFKESNEMSFGERKNAFVSLIKAHGSLNWFEIADETRYFPNSKVKTLLTPKIIPPSEGKFFDSIDDPFRNLITKADEKIEKALAFFVVGFGFNDRHITVRLEKKIKGDKGKPIVLITKEATPSAKEKMRKAKEFLILESTGNGKTKATYREHNSPEEKERIIEGSHWELPNFMKYFSKASP